MEDHVPIEIIQGKVKTLFSTDQPDQVLIQYEDRVTAGNGEKDAILEGKGNVCCLISAVLFEHLEKCGIRTHYQSLPTWRAMACKKLSIIPVEVICRNIAAGSIVKTTNITQGTLINPPLVEFFLKDDSKNDPLLTPDRVRLMGVDTKPLIDITLEVNHHLQSLFTLMGFDLVDFKLEYGYDNHGDLFLADELSPDNMRLWKKGTQEKFDKDLFRNDEGDIVEAYKYILKELRKFI